MASRIDVNGLKRTADLSLVVKHYLGAPARTNGRGLWWRCPFHAEKSASFLVGGRQDQAQQFHCFGCGQHGDVIEFVRRMEHLGEDGKAFVAAVKRVAEISGATLPTGGGSAADYEREEGPSGSPAMTWQARAREFCEQAQAALWSDLGVGCLRWLREVRGLADETIREWGLGWNVGTYKDASERWDLQERDKPVWLPQGLVIPGLVAGVMWYVKIRPSKTVRSYFQGKYYQVPMPLATERGALLGCDRWQPQLPALLCEGEMDCMTVWQEGRSLVNPGTLGGAAKGRTGERLNFGRWLLRLSAMPRILVAYDADVAGQQAEAALARISTRFEPVSVPWGTDVNEFHVSGGNVPGWLAQVLGVETPKVKPAYPVVLIFDNRPGLPVIGNQWRRLSDGRIEATFNSPEELELVLDVAKAIGVYGAGAQSLRA